MIGRNALLVTKEHGHRPLTMLKVYAAWVEGAPESDIRAIRAARNPKEWKPLGTGKAPPGHRSTTPDRSSPRARDAV